MVKIVQQGSEFPGQREIFVQAVQLHAGFQLFQVLFDCFPGGSGLFPVAEGIKEEFDLFDQLPFGEQHLSRRGDRQGVQRVGSPLGVQFKIGDGVNVVSPILDSDGVGFPRREEVEDTAPDGKLADPVHLGTADIAGRNQAADQLLHRTGLIFVRVEADGKGGLF